MGTTAEDVVQHINLLLQLNDWSLRTIAALEMKAGFCWVQAKLACLVAAFAMTPDDLGENWAMVEFI
jgi:fumarylacetoacetate (FAA) hydrolase